MRRGLDIGNGAKQPFGVRVARTLEQILGARLLHLAPGIHHDHAVGVLGDHTHVMGDQNDRRAKSVLKLPHQSQESGPVSLRQRCVGSSAISSLGLHDTAIAIMTR